MKSLSLWCLGLCLVGLTQSAVLGGGEHHGQDRVLHGKKLSEKAHHLNDDGKWPTMYYGTYILKINAASS